ncbi:Uncharacterized protein HZ326_15947, partial [Fusarium oxysporum f. sp. albedinis]
MLMFLVDDCVFLSVAQHGYSPCNSTTSGE